MAGVHLSARHCNMIKKAINAKPVPTAILGIRRGTVIRSFDKTPAFACKGRLSVTGCFLREEY